MESTTTTSTNMSTTMSTADAGDPASGNHWIIMPKGAHHLDLRGPHPEDPPDVTAARAQEEAIIKGWIEDHATDYNSRVF
jgi:hypothetical protein